MLVDEELEAQLYLQKMVTPPPPPPPAPGLLASHSCTSHYLHQSFSGCGPEAAATDPETPKSEGRVGLLCSHTLQGILQCVKPILRYVKRTCSLGR